VRIFTRVFAGSFARAGIVLGFLFVLSAAAVAQPAWACGCGAVIAESEVAVDDETSIVRYDAATRTQEIVMRLSARSAAKDAAWLFPTPSEARVTLGERGWFEQLEELTKPRVVKDRIWFPLPLGAGGGGDAGQEAPGGGSGVDVLGERDLGPFRVATLDARDPGALARWLGANGYRLSPELEKALGPYVRQGWKYVAVKLRLRNGRALTGELPPLRVSFSSGELVYPMRLSRLAKSAQTIRLYVLAANRVKQTTGVEMGVQFAGRVTPGQVRSPGLRRFLGDGLFMTELVQIRISPASIYDDYRFTATENVPFREVIREQEVVLFLGLPAGWLLWFAGGPTVTLTIVFGARRLARRRPRTAA
jgi:hypothetical protein